jgi:serine/threonine-protein kinase
MLEDISMLRSPGKWHSTTRRAAVGGATLVALALTGAAPAMAAPGGLPAPVITANAAAAAQAQPIGTWPVTDLWDAQTRRCLDSNAAGAAYTNLCQWPGNHYQDWTITEWEAFYPTGVPYDFFSLKDRATGRCLDSNAAGALYTSTCQAPGNAYQRWYRTVGYLSGSLLSDGATGLCLDSNDAGNAYTHVCNGGRYQQWTSPDAVSPF